MEALHRVLAVDWSRRGRDLMPVSCCCVRFQVTAREAEEEANNCKIRFKVGRLGAKRSEFVGFGSRQSGVRSCVAA